MIDRLAGAGNERSRAARVVAAALPFVAALLYAAIVAGPGVPALRHDWSWPAGRAELGDLLARSLSAWDPRGIGSPNLYVNDFAIALGVALCVFVFGSHLGLFAFATAIAAVCAYGAASLARTVGAGLWGRAGVAAIALFNPWVYTQTVAGHTYMILAFGALTWLAAECLRKSPRPLVAAVLVVLTLQQLQFFIAAILLAAVLAVRNRTYLPLVTAIVVSAPLVTSVAAETHAYRSVPYAIAWTASQSVAPANALALTGYFAGYSQSVDRLDIPLVTALFVIAIIGFASIARSRRAAAFVAVTACALVAAMGLRGPAGALEGFAMSSVPATRIFRELYDLLGFAAIGYCAGLGAASRRAAGATAACIGGCTLAASWLIWSPWAYWVPVQAIPPASIDAPASSRFALLPAFQPLMRVDGSGSGLDPDATIRAGAVDPVNSPLSSFPVDAALAAFEQRHDSEPLAALGVSLVVERPWLKSDDDALAAQRALPTRVSAADPPLTTRVDRIAAAPLLSLDALPATCTVCASSAADAVFFGDVAGMRGATIPQVWAAYPRVISVAAQTGGVRADQGWVDARLAFAADPDLGQPFGGAVTTASGPILPLTPSAHALVFVRGRIASPSGDVIATTTRGYEWVWIPPGVRGVRCEGLCVVALEAPFVPAPSLRAASTEQAEALTLRAFFPWLGSVEIPAGQASFLRYLVAFDRGWLAIGPDGPFEHVPVDGVTNGWLLPARATRQTVTIIEWPSAVAALFEVVGLVWALYLIALLPRSLAGRHDETARERRA